MSEYIEWKGLEREEATLQSLLVGWDTGIEIYVEGKKNDEPTGLDIIRCIQIPDLNREMLAKRPMSYLLKNVRSG